MIVVHIGGIITPRITEIAEICQRAGIPLIEDAAHAHGATLNGKAAGSFGLAASFSFYPTKVMTSGEGGMITTDDESLYREALIYRDQGKEGFTTNFHVRLGYNWRMSEPHAVIGLAQLKRLPEFIERRREIAAVYDAGLPKLGEHVHALPNARGVRSNYYKYIAMLDRVSTARRSRRRCARSSTSASAARSTRRRATCSRSSRIAKAAPSRSPSASAPTTSACLSPPR